MSLNDLYSPKQQEVLRFALNNDFFMLINHGAKRSGKTVLDNDLFLNELIRTREIADKYRITKPQYILAGSDQGAVQRNVLNELENKYGLSFQFDKYNRFVLFGVQVCCFGHSKINDLNRIRGMTSYGAYINEATMANREVFNEISKRCSGTGARILMDTNPDCPSHWLKKDYIDKADGKSIAQFQWKLTDNTFVDERYIENTKATTPTGMFYDRDINGAWVAAAGIVYPDFERNVHYIRADQVPPIVRHWAGKDFGWEHPGALCLLGEGMDGNIYLLRGWKKKHRPIEKWIEIGLGLTSQFGDINFYCDSARPDLIYDMQVAGLRAINARKDVVAGIAAVATLFKTRRLFVVEKDVEGFDEEIDTYAWDEGKEQPVKENDDIMDAMRYGIYSDQMYGER
nr:MAG TPA: large terminase [Caudoviricetes sp.]